MTNPKRPRYTTDYTQKIRLCRGCHNELPDEVDACPVCRTKIELDTSPAHDADPGHLPPGGDPFEG